MPDVSDHWAAYGLATVAAWPGADPAHPLPDALVPLLERQAGVLGLQIRWESQRSDGWLNTLLRGGHAIPAGLGSLGEGIAGLWRVAEVDPRLTSLAGALGDRATCAAGMVASRQVTPAQAAAYPEPGRVQGAWFHGGLTRMDDEQHTLSAMVRSLPIAEQGRPGRPGATTDLPAVLGVLALVAVANPARAALGFPAAGRSRRQRLTIGAIGGARRRRPRSSWPPSWPIRVLDALHISPPTRAHLRRARGGGHRHHRPRRAGPVARARAARPGRGAGAGARAPRAAARPGPARPQRRPPTTAWRRSSSAACWCWPARSAPAPSPRSATGPVRIAVRWTMAVLAVVAIAAAIALAVDGVFDV